MSEEELRPFPEDQSAVEHIEMFDLDDEDWLYSTSGDYQTLAVQAFKRDGSNPQDLIALQWPVRNRKTGEEKTLRLLISVPDAKGLVTAVAHSAMWVQERNELKRRVEEAGGEWPGDVT